MRDRVLNGLPQTKKTGEQSAQLSAATETRRHSCQEARGYCTEKPLRQTAERGVPLRAETLGIYIYIISNSTLQVSHPFDLSKTSLNYPNSSNIITNARPKMAQIWVNLRLLHPLHNRMLCTMYNMFFSPKKFIKILWFIVFQSEECTLSSFVT